MLVEDTEKAIAYFNTLNFVDSDIHGFRIDGFKISILIGSFESVVQHHLGLNETYADLVFHFVYPSEAKINFERPMFAYSVVDGELDHFDISKFRNFPAISRVGLGANPKRYRVEMEIDGGSLSFEFIELRIDTVDIETLAIGGLADYAYGAGEG